MNRNTLKALISEIVQEISADTMNKAGHQAKAAQKYSQAGRFYDAAEKKEGSNRQEALAKAIGNAPRKFKVDIPGEGSFMSAGTTEIELTGLYKRGGSPHVEFKSSGFLGMGKITGEIVVSEDGHFFVFRNGSNSLPVSPKFDRNGIITMHKITGIPNQNIPRTDALKEGKATLKKVIKQMVLREMTNNTNKVGTTDGSNDEPAVTALGKAIKDGVAAKVAGSSKVTADSPKHQVELKKKSDDCYDVVSVTNGGERKTAQNLKLEDAMSFIKDHAKETEETYQNKAYNKSLKAAGRDVKKDEKAEEKRVKANDKQEDQMEDAEETKQIDIADDNTKDAEEKVDSEVAPIGDDVAPQLGGELVDKISRIIDRVLKDKADAKSAHLKADSDMESPDKLVVKTKETPKLKEKK